MKQRWILYAATGLVAASLAGGCSHLRKLTKSEPEVGLYQPAHAGSGYQPPQAPDTARSMKIITYRKQDGTELTLTPVDVDSVTGEKIMSVAIDEVVISASNRRNLVERNGKINVEFVVTVPETFQRRNWQLVLDPLLQKGADTMQLDPLVYSGDRFRDMQQREYARYGRYRSRIVDSADYFSRFGNRRAYLRYMRYVEDKRGEYGIICDRLENLPPREAMFDEQAGWVKPRVQRRQNALMRSYVRSTDRKVARWVTYTPREGDRFDHLNDYFTPRYRYEGVEVLPGGDVYTRVDGEYPLPSDQQREDYLHALASNRSSVRREVSSAGSEDLRRMAAERAAYTGRNRKMVDGLLRATGDSAVLANYRIQKDIAAERLAYFNALDTAAMRGQMLRWGKVYRNRKLDENSSRAFARLVPHPYFADARLDTVLRRPDGKIDYHYTEQIQADENTSRLYLYLAGAVTDRSDRRYLLGKSDTLIYSVASMTNFIDDEPRYMQRIVLRDAEANARFYFTFPAGKSELVDTLTENRNQLYAVRELTRSLMTDPVYIIDSITLRATASPEGTWKINERLAQERAEALRRVLVSQFRVMYDSLRVAASVTLDDEGREVLIKGNDETLPNLPNLLRTKHLAEDWGELRRLVEADQQMPDKEEVLAMMSWDGDPDTREWRIRAKYPKAYDHMRRVLYPQMRAVDFRFNLHRRGMQQDTVYTTEIDSSYMHAVDLLKKRRYEEALTILRPYEDRNTALAYMSLGYDAAAYRILKEQPNADATADIQYMLAILASRLGDEEQAVHYFLRSTELRENLKFRGNLDPEISRLIRKYGLFREDFM